MATPVTGILRTARRKAAQGELPVWRQLLEMAYLLLRHRIGPGYYLTARMWRRAVPFAAKCRHWNGDRYLRHVHAINDPRYYKVSQNKLVEKALLRTLGIPTVELVGLFHCPKGQAADGTRLADPEDLRRVLAARVGMRLFFKPAEGDNGHGVFALDVAEGEAELVLSRPLDGAALTVEELAARLSGMPNGTVIEHCIDQHPELARLNPSSVNTLRMWVLDDGGTPRVVGAFLRIGRAGSEADNTAQGGLPCPIDLVSGRIRHALDQTLDCNEHAVHPDSGVPLAGLPIPYWEECVALACNAVRVLPGARFAGMDIAVSRTGPLVVEYNVEPNYHGAALFDVPHGELFAAQPGPLAENEAAGGRPAARGA